MMKNNLESFSPDLVPDWVIGIDSHPQKSETATLLVDENFLALINSSTSQIDFEDLGAENEMATFYSTSGTSGVTKYQAISARQLWNDALRIHSSNLCGDDEIFILLPFGAAWTTVHAIYSLILGKTYFNCMFTNYELPRFVSRYQIRTIIGSPSQVSAFLDIQSQTGTQLPLLKTIIMGGSPPGEHLVERIRSTLDARIFNAYGSTEAGLVTISRLGVEDSEGGWIIPGIELQIVDEAQRPLPQNSVGRIRYKREDMTIGYYENPQATSGFFLDGYFYPGDLGSIDSVGRLHLAGRDIDILNLGGVKINPEVIEAIAHAQLGVRDCAVYTFAGTSGLEEVGIALVVDSDFERDNFERAMAKKSPYRISKARVVPEIPRNETGKIQRDSLNWE